jgi:hypothetical protein
MAEGGSGAGLLVCKEELEARWQRAQCACVRSRSEASSASVVPLLCRVFGPTGEAGGEREHAAGKNSPRLICLVPEIA